MLSFLIAAAWAATPAPPKKPPNAIDPNTLYALHWDRPSHQSCEAVDMNKSFDSLISYLKETPQTNARVYSGVDGKHYIFNIIFVERSKGRRLIYNRILASDRAYCLAKQARFKNEAARLERTGEVLDLHLMRDVTDQLIGPQPPLNLAKPRS